MSPFKSTAQMKYMFANMPEMAKRWAKETPNIKSLPKKKSSGPTKMEKRKAK